MDMLVAGLQGVDPIRDCILDVWRRKETFDLLHWSENTPTIPKPFVKISRI